MVVIILMAMGDVGVGVGNSLRLSLERHNVWMSLVTVGCAFGVPHFLTFRL